MSIKKTVYPSKGSYPITIKTINGSFEFEVTRYRTTEGSSNWLRVTTEKRSRHHESELLQEFACRYASCLSYQKTSQLVSDRSASTRLSDQRIAQMVQEKAQELVAEQQQLIAQSKQPAEAVKAVAVDLYSGQTKEVVWLADGICVAEQKARRDKQRKSGKERVTTEIRMLERQDGSFRRIVAGEAIAPVHLYRAEVAAEYGRQAKELAVVAITDGARSLKREVKEVFGERVCHILDWYHLQVKVFQLMTQIALNKQGKGTRIFNQCLMARRKRESHPTLGSNQSPQ